MGRSSQPTGGYGGVVRRLRLDAGFTIAEVADAVEMSPGYVAKIELGQANPSRGALTRIAVVLGVQPSTVLELAGFLPTAIVDAFRATPDAMLWFAELPNAKRQEMSSANEGDQALQDRRRLRRMLTEPRDKGMTECPSPPAPSAAASPAFAGPTSRRHR